MGSWTILFTDIEGSTQLWETQPGAMSRALGKHDGLARHSVERHRGKVVKTMGDGLQAVFGDPLDGVMAAVELQQALADPAATEGLPLRIRCGLHLGEVEQRDDDFFGPPVNRSARIMGAAHGGQVLLSQAVVDGVAGRLPGQITVLDLGEVRLRGLASPERVFQVVHPMLRQAFPPLRSLELTPHNLPQQVSTFVGRDRELEELGDWLQASRLVTLWGMGGLGKTRLSLQVATRALQDFPDGAWFVDLAPLKDGALVPGALAQVLAVQEEPGRSLTDTLCAHLRTRKLLVILDNCEHLVDACARLADRLLRSASDVRILATTREPLHVAGERTYPIVPLPVPERTQSLDSLRSSDAVRLFVDRARAHDPAFELTAREAPAVAEIVAQLEGIPLALELAAARVRTLSLADLNARLRDRFKLLERGGGVALERQQTLRALVDWSYGLLDDKEKALFDRLGVFAGGFDLASCEQVCGTAPLAPGDVLDLVASLVEKSLVMAQVHGDGARYRTLDTIRDYARERLVARDALAAVELRHRDHYFELAKSANRGIDGPERAACLQRLDSDLDNIRAAEAHCLQSGGDPIVGVKIEVALTAFRINRGYATEGRAQLASLLATAPVRESDLALAWVLNTQAVLSMSQGHLVEAADAFRRCLALRRAIGHQREVASTVSSLAMVLFQMGHLVEASALEHEALAQFRELGLPNGEGVTALHLGNIALYNQDYDAARILFDEAIEIGRRIGNHEHEAEGERCLGDLALELDRVDEARRRYARSLEVSRASGTRREEAEALRGLGCVGLATRDLALARRTLHAALRACETFEGRTTAIACLDGCARLELLDGNTERAIRLLAAATAQCQAFSIKRSPASEERFQAVALDVDRSMHPADREAVRAEASEWSLDESIRYALAEVCTATPSKSVGPLRAELGDAEEKPIVP